MKTVLVVDDEPKIVQLARDYLEHAGFAVVTAGDGRSALAAIRTRRPDLVVLDLALPELDGLDVTRAIRSDSNLPIVMLTPRDDELAKLLARELGADDYINNPLSPPGLAAPVRAAGPRPERKRAWWPADEPWPPTGPPYWVRGGRGPWGYGRQRWWGRGPHRYMWAFGCLLAAFMVVALSAAIVSLWLFAFGSLMPGGGTEPSGFGLGRATGLIVLVVGVLVLVRIGRRVRRFTEPLDELVDAVGRVEAGDYTVRVQERGGPGEMRGLAHGFNTMTTRLEADERQRRSLL